MQNNDSKEPCGECGHERHHHVNDWICQYPFVLMDCGCGRFVSQAQASELREWTPRWMTVVD